MHSEDKTNQKLLLSISEASKLVGLDDKILSDEIKSGRLNVFKLCGMINPKIPRAELIRWIENNTIIINQSMFNNRKAL